MSTAVAILLLLTVIGVGIFMWRPWEDKNGSPSPTPVPAGVGGKLILTTENQGFDSFISQGTQIPPFPPGRIASVPLIYLVKPADTMIAFFKQGETLVKVNNPAFLNFEYWLQLDVLTGDTYETAMCTDVASCTKVYKDLVDGANQAMKVAGYTDTITGLHFDNEGSFLQKQPNGLDIIIQSMQAVSNGYSPKLQLSFTKGVGNCGSPASVSGVPFDFCLGQTYTDCTADLFSKVKCGEIDIETAMTGTSKYYWGNPGLVTGGYSTPLFCVAGCGTVDRTAAECDSGGKTNVILNETLSTAGLQSIMDYMSKPEVAVKFPNFGFYNGTISQVKGVRAC